MSSTLLPVNWNVNPGFGGERPLVYLQGIEGAMLRSGDRLVENLSGLLSAFLEFLRSNGLTFVSFVNFPVRSLTRLLLRNEGLCSHLSLMLGML